MKSQIGIYEDADMGIDEWDSLIYLQSEGAPSDLLDRIRPFLREFHLRRDMADTASLGAWLIWHLAMRADVRSFSGIAIERKIRHELDFFYRISPGLVEVFRVDDLLEWRPLARIEIPCDIAEVEAR